MSLPVHRLENLSLNQTMPMRTRGSDSLHSVPGPSGKTYDLTSLSAAQGDAAYDGLRSEHMRLAPVLTKATFPETGYIGFEVIEIHQVRIPLPDDQREETPGIQCNCATFERLNLCAHVVWLYDSLQASLEASPLTPERMASETLTDLRLLRRFTEMATKMPGQSRGLTERINRLQPNQAKPHETDQAILDVFAVFDGISDDSPRKRRRPEESPDELKPVTPKLRTCLEISRDEFFDDVNPPENDIRDVVVPGKLLPTMKGLVRYGTVFREALFRVVDAHFRADDFLSRLDGRLGDWKERWENFRKDRRTTVPSSFVTDYAGTLREVLRQMTDYDKDRDCPDSFYDQAIDLGITMLDEIVKSNADLYEGHSRQNTQARHTVPQNARDRNLFTNLILDPPVGQVGFIRGLVTMLFQFGPEQFDDNHVGKMRHLYAELNEIETVSPELISPLQHFLQRYMEWRRDQVGQTEYRSPASQASSTQHPHTSDSNDQAQARRYRELRAAPPS